MNTTPARHTWVLAVNERLVGLWSEGGIVRLCLPNNIRASQALERPIHDWINQVKAEMDKRKGK